MKPAAANSKSRVAKKPVEDEYEEDYEGESEESADGRKACPMCGEMIIATAAKCRFCGEVFDSRVASKGRRRGASKDYAGIWPRFVASFADGVLVLILASAIGFVVGMVVGGAIGGAGGNVQKHLETLRLIGNLIGLVTGWLYAALQESSEAQATPGKKMMGLRVTDLNGDRISFARATGRHFGKYLSLFTLFIGYIMAAFTTKKQALHDLMAGTVVVKN
jgi:uncharacterized RDD family membrane protein YckC